jgi:hypothetical protein
VSTWGIAYKSVTYDKTHRVGVHEARGHADASNGRRGTSTASSEVPQETQSLLGIIIVVGGGSGALIHCHGVTGIAHQHHFLAYARTV